MTISRPIQAPPFSIGHSLFSRDLIRCVVVLEDRPVMRERLEEMLKDAYWVVITTENWRECRDWALKNVRIFILDNVLPDDPAGGLKALDEIKKVAPEAFCAIVTEDLSRVGNVAKNLRADHLCGKTDEELEILLRKLDDLAPPLSEREQAREIGQRLVDRFPDVDVHLASGSISSAEHALVQLEGPLSEAVRLKSLGEDFATVIDSLHFSLINAPGKGLGLNQWSVWKDVARRAFESFPINLAQAISFSRELSSAGWITQPPNFPELSDFLLACEEDGDPSQDG